MRGGTASPLWIYHLVPASELRRGLREDAFRPDRLAADGFVHCAPRGAVLAIAADYFTDVAEPLLLLEIDPARLTSELRFEAPAPRADGGTSHLLVSDRFPHVYGPIDRDAIVGVGRLRPVDGGFAWPAGLVPLDAALGELSGDRAPGG